jgi:RsiW-degrading membrane proteinase PrsW (M82 family)
MNRKYLPALIAAALGVGAVLWAILPGGESESLALFLAAGAAPIAALLAVRARLDLPMPGRAVFGGAVIGPIVALASHTFVAAFAYVFFLGFAESGRKLLDALRADPHIITLLASPWVIVLLIELTAVAPLTEEAGKALGARLARPTSPGEAFMAGVAAGAGFAVVENILYAVTATSLGGPWPAVVLGRALGAAVHPLATGLVSLGWYEWKRDRNLLGLLRRYLSGVAVHALWNGSLVALFVVQTAFELKASPQLGAVALSYEATLGIAAAGLLWMATSAIASGRDPFAALDFRQGRAVAGWTLLAASVMVPVGMLIVAFPGFYLG